MRASSVVCLLALSPVLTGCEPALRVAESISERSSNEGTGLFLAWLSSDTAFRPTQSQLGVSADSKTLYFAGRSQDRTDSAIYAYEIETAILTSIVPQVSGLEQIVATSGDSILYSLRSGEIRLARRGQVGSEATAAVAAPKAERGFVASANGRFVFRQTEDARSEVVDLASGDRKIIPISPVALLAVSNDGDQVVYRDNENQKERVDVRRITTNSVRLIDVRRPGGVSATVASAAWVGDTLLVMVFERVRVADSDTSWAMAEVDIDRGTRRILGQDRMLPPSGPLGWSPGAHRAAGLHWLTCRTNHNGSHCLMNYYDLLDFNATKRRVGRLYSEDPVGGAVVSPDGKMLIYMADRLYIKKF